MPVGLLLQVDLRPGLPALYGVLSVLSARAATIGAIDYATNPCGASLSISVGGTPDVVRRLAAQVERRVDVLGVAVTTGGA